MMTGSNQKGYETFTPEAVEEVQRATSRIQRELLIKARLVADARNSDKVTRIDVYRAERAMADSAPEVRSRRVQSSWLSSLAPAVGALGSLALALAVYWLIGLNEKSSKVSLLFAAGATTASFVGAAFSVWTHRAERNERLEIAAASRGSRPTRDEQRWELVATWADIERMLTESIPRESDRHAPVGIIVRDYARRSGLGEEFIEDINRALSARNKVAHGAAGDLTGSDLESALAAAKRLKSEISQQVSEN
ncbi:hypothetical protein GCM10023235_38340 [Kitasatospora terrestris]|uniref:RiboL-PSP-HEPN domain-containing protein n=1 Tax=Kitasatospora terrestris TaxID=258051 RepID=A0ABP9DUE1_9ACTN